jgi:hypothetical protein
MAQQTINGPANASSHMGPNTGDSPELGDSWAAAIAKINANFTDAYSAVRTANGPFTAFAGGGQASATPLGYGVNRIGTVATAGDSCLLPAAVAGARVIVSNAAQNAIQLFGKGTDTINGVVAATGVTQAGPSSCTYTCDIAGQWESNDVGDGYAGNFSTVTVSPAAGLTAHAGGGQASATPMTWQINRFSTVATAADSGLLPPAKHGAVITIINDTATSMNIFPCSQAQGGVTGGDSINTGGQNAAYALAGNKYATAYCAVDGKWHVILSA